MQHHEKDEYSNTIYMLNMSQLIKAVNCFTNETNSTKHISKQSVFSCSFSSIFPQKLWRYMTPSRTTAMTMRWRSVRPNYKHLLATEVATFTAVWSQSRSYKWFTHHSYTAVVKAGDQGLSQPRGVGIGLLHHVAKADLFTGISWCGWQKRESTIGFNVVFVSV